MYTSDIHCGYFIIRGKARATENTYNNVVYEEGIKRELNRKHIKMSV